MYKKCVTKSASITQLYLSPSDKGHIVYGPYNYYQINLIPSPPKSTNDNTTSYTCTTHSTTQFARIRMRRRQSRSYAETMQNNNQYQSKWSHVPKQRLFVCVLRFLRVAGREKGYSSISCVCANVTLFGLFLLRTRFGIYLVEWRYIILQKTANTCVHIVRKAGSLLFSISLVYDSCVCVCVVSQQQQHHVVQFFMRSYFVQEAAAATT